MDEQMMAVRQQPAQLVGVVVNNFSFHSSRYVPF
jgi:hypothetical protein